MDRGTPSRYDCIQLLRALAALAVVGQHLPTLSLGAWGVDLFFLISGFIVCHVTEGSTDRFFTKRLIRVVPLYWAGTLMVFAVAALAPGLMNSTSADPVQLLKSLLFVPFAKGELVRPVLFLGWTLNYEMFFYAVFFVSMLCSHRHRALVCACLLAGMVAAGAAWPSEHVVLAFYSDPLILEFILGMACFHLVKGGVIPLGKGRHPARTLLAGAAVLGFLYLSPAQDGLPTRLVVWGLPALWLFLVTLTGAGRVRLPAGLTLLGDASYSLYLFHPYIVQVLDRKLHAFDPARGTLFNVLMGVGAAALCAVVAVGIYLAVERPLTAWLRQRFVTGSEAAPTAAPTVFGGSSFSPDTAVPTLHRG